MTRATLWSAVVLASLAAGTGCGSLPTMQAFDLKPGPAPLGIPKGPPATAPAGDTTTGPNVGFNFDQYNGIGSVSAGDGSEVSIQQVNRTVTMVLDDPLELLKHYVEISDQLAWDPVTHRFYISQANYSASETPYAPSTAYRQINNLAIIVDPHATIYSGVIDQSNGLGSVTAGSDGRVDIVQVNHVSIIHSGEDGLDADQYVDTLKLALDGVSPPAGTDWRAYAQVHEWIVYIDYLGLPHLYRWQAPVGKNGMAAFRPDR